MEILCPRYSTAGSIKAHFALFSRSPAFSNHCRTSSKFLRCLSSMVSVIKTSSMYTLTCSTPWRILSIVLWNMDGADATPSFPSSSDNTTWCLFRTAPGFGHDAGLANQDVSSLTSLSPLDWAHPPALQSVPRISPGLGR